MGLMDQIKQSIETARTRLRHELGTPQERRTAAKRIADAAREAFLPDPPGGPEYDEYGDTIYPEGAVILHDHARDERNPWSRYPEKK